MTKRKGVAPSGQDPENDSLSMKEEEEDDDNSEYQGLIWGRGSATTITAEEKGVPKQVFVILLGANFVAIVYFFLSNNTATSTVAKCKNNNNNNNTNGWVRPNKIYGHVHVAKTAGSEINGMLSMEYERVCGNKGYSFSAISDQEQYVKNEWIREDHLDRPYPAMVQRDQMFRWGFDDCDYVSMEVGRVEPWEYIYTKWPMEMHVPCRNPLDHLMSMNNHKVGKGKGKNFNCTADLAGEVKKAVLGMGRMKAQFSQSSNVTLKCFDPLPPQKYVDYMGVFLQHKRVRADYVHKATNKPRNKNEECVWNQSQEWKDNLVKFLHKRYYYFRFCAQCMGSENKLSL